MLPFLYEQSLNSGEMSLQLCNSPLKAVFRNIPYDMKFFIVLDGINECNSQERRKLMPNSLTTVTSINDPSYIRGLFVSQDEPDLKGLLRTATRVKITESDNEEDIKCYVNRWQQRY